MAVDKKSFILYSDLIHTVNKMPSEKAGDLFKHILSYVNDEEPVSEDLIIQLTFEPIKQQLKRDLKKYKEIKSKRSDAGKESARLRALKKEQQNKQKSTSVESVQQTPTNPTVNDNVNVNVNVNDNDVVLNNDVFFSLDVLKSQYLQNKKLVKAFIDNPENKIKSEQELKNRIETFIIHLNEVGRHKETFKEFSSYFRHWNKKAPTKASSKEDYHASLKRNIVF